MVSSVKSCPERTQDEFTIDSCKELAKQTMLLFLASLGLNQKYKNETSNLITKLSTVDSKDEWQNTINKLDEKSQKNDIDSKEVSKNPFSSIPMPLVGEVSPSDSPGVEIDRSNPPLMKSKEINKLIPSTNGSHLEINSFGYVTEDVSNIDQFLADKYSKNSGMLKMSHEGKANSQFFKELASTSFNGEITLRSSSKSYKAAIDFIGDSRSEEERIHIFDDKEQYLERRASRDSESELSWRYGAHKRGIILMNQVCPWNNKYSYEYKEFFYLANSGQLVANVYCSTNPKTGWDLIGIMKLSQK